MLPLSRLRSVLAALPRAGGPFPIGLLLAGAVALGTALSVPARAADPAEDVLPLPGKAGDFTLSVPDIAEDGASGWYARIDGGYANVRTGDATWTAPGAGLFAFPIDGGDAWTVGGGIGYHVTPWLRGEVALDYLSPTGPSRLAATSAFASLYWDIITWNGLTPYLGGGVGMAIVSIDADAFGPVAGFAQNDWRFAWNLSAGVAWSLTPRLSIDAGYRYLDFGSPGFTSATGQLVVNDMTAHQVRLGLRYALQ